MNSLDFSPFFQGRDGGREVHFAPEPRHLHLSASSKATCLCKYALSFLSYFICLQESLPASFGTSQEAKVVNFLSMWRVQKSIVHCKKISFFSAASLQNWFNLFVNDKRARYLCDFLSPIGHRAFDMYQLWDPLFCKKKTNPEIRR